MEKIEICDSSALLEGGLGYRFNVVYNEEAASAFVVRVDNEVRGFLNRCSHIPVELDWNHAEFLEDSGLMIVCATHGATYDGASGRCLGGPCNGNPLVSLQIIEKNGKVFWEPSASMTVPSAGIQES